MHFCDLLTTVKMQKDYHLSVSIFKPNLLLSLGACQITLHNLGEGGDSVSNELFAFLKLLFKFFWE